MSKIRVLTILAPWVDLAVLLRGFCLFDFTGSFLLSLYHKIRLCPTKLKLFSWHKWLGVTIFLIAVARLLWRMTHRVPGLPDSTPAWQRVAAAATHWVIYALLLAIPISGWLMSSASGFQVVYFGVLPLPDLLQKDKALAGQLQLVHETLNYTLMALLVVHVGAALKHHLRLLGWKRRNSQCRHQKGTMSKVDEMLIGTKGKIFCGAAHIKDNSGKVIFQFDRVKENDPYQSENDELFAAIAKGEYKFADTENGAKSTMTALVGRMATYSGQVIEFDKALNSGINIMPTKFAWDANPPVLPDANGFYPIATPGVTKYFS
jgi:cytochrome b561